jgi:hypothetical protein
MLRGSSQSARGAGQFSEAPVSGFNFIHNRYPKMFRQENRNAATSGKSNSNKKAGDTLQESVLSLVVFKMRVENRPADIASKQEIQAISNEHLPIIQVSVELEPTKGFCGFDGCNLLRHPGAGFSACLVKSRLDRSPEFLNRRPIRKVLSHLSVNSAFRGSFYTYPAGSIENLKFFSVVPLTGRMLLIT